jgi:hypothetical protein
MCMVTPRPTPGTIRKVDNEVFHLPSIKRANQDFSGTPPEYVTPRVDPCYQQTAWPDVNIGVDSYYGLEPS